MSHIYCAECGFQNSEAANYCARCGAMLEREASEAETTLSYTPESLTSLRKSSSTRADSQLSPSTGPT